MTILHEYGRIAPGVLTADGAVQMHKKFESLIEVTTREAVMAATESLDANMLANFRMNTKRSPGPCGDRLAGELHKVIEAHIRQALGLLD